MIYVPMLKTKKVEMNVLKELNDCFSDQIMPLIEIIKENYDSPYKVDENGDFIWVKREKQMRRVKCEPEEKYVNTLSYLNNLLGNKKAFIDYFRFSIDKYGKDVDVKNKAELSYRLNNNVELYKNKVLSITSYKNLIPVISLKPEYIFSLTDLQIMIQQLHIQTVSIAIRLTDEYFEQYLDILKQELNSLDYLLFDIGEQKPNTKFMELEELKESGLKCNVILLNSPRKTKIDNKDYPEYGVTDLIDNSARDIAGEYDLYGYGDYCGLKDDMPKPNQPIRGGAALALLFDYNSNSFFSYCNHDTSLGTFGYNDIIRRVLKDEKKNNPDGDCPGYRKIHTFNNGGWQGWIYVNAARYIYQTYKYMEQ